MRSSSYTLFHRSEINYYSSKLPRSADWKCRVNLIGLFTTVSHEKGAESVFKKKKEQSQELMTNYWVKLFECGKVL